MHTLANSEDLDEMLHDAAFHQGLHCLLSKIKTIFRKRITISFRNLLPVIPQYIQWTIKGVLFQTRRENSFVHKGLNVPYSSL